MKKLNDNVTALQEFAPMLEKTNSMGKVWISILVLILLAGLYAVILQVSEGHTVTGMRDNVVWGFYIVNFLYILGISYASAFIGAILHFVKTPWKNPIIRIIEMVTVFSLIVGPIYILLCIGRVDRLHYLFLYPRIQSPITWDVIAIVTDLIVCILYLYLTFIPDLAVLRDYDGLKVPKWQKKIYKLFSLGYRDTPSQKKLLQKATKAMSTMIIIMAIAIYTVLAWIFSLTLQPGWNSTIFAPYFMVSGIYAGIAMIIIVMFVFRKVYRLEDHIKRRHFTMGGFAMMIVALLFGYFTLSEYFSRWYSNKQQDIDLLGSLFDRYFWHFIFANYVTVFLPLLVILIKKLRTIPMITATAVIAMLGVWINRFLIVVPTLENPYIPIQDSRLEYVFYSATWIEWILILAGISGICLLFTLASKFVPIVPIQHILEGKSNKPNKLFKGMVE